MVFREVKAMQNNSGVVVTSSENGWISDDLNAHWLQKVMGKFHFGPSLGFLMSHQHHYTIYYKPSPRVSYGISCSKPVRSWEKEFKKALIIYLIQ